MDRKLQVFISSTYSDLKLERQAAVSAILKSGHIPAGMELFTAGDVSQMDVIKRWIDESDVYMLILGARYGSIEPTSGKSYTELEFDYAVEKKKPHFSIVIDESVIDDRVKESGRAILELDHNDKLKAFRRKVLSKISSFFKDEKDIRLAVFESLGDLAARPDLEGWVKASAVQMLETDSNEIKRLREKVASLEANLAEAKKKNTPSSSNHFLSLSRLLGSIKIQLSEKVKKEGYPDEISLLDMFIGNQKAFVAGVTNSPMNNADADFLYYDVATKLKIHGMMREKKLTGKKIECLATSALGDQFLAWYDKITKATDPE